MSNTLSDKSLKILFWNARSINKRKNELVSILEGIDIFVCVESWLNEKDETIFHSQFVQYKKIGNTRKVEGY